MKRDRRLEKGRQGNTKYQRLSIQRKTSMQVGGKIYMGLYKIEKVVLSNVMKL